MLKILEPGIQTTVQDLGRIGYQGYGIPVSGAMDSFSFCEANALVGNIFSAAALEIHSPIVLETVAPALAAVTGADAILVINGRQMPMWTATLVRPGYQIEIAPKRSGGWYYLAIAGGIDVPPVLGSRSTYLRGQLGGFYGRALETGDEVNIGAASSSDWLSQAGSMANDRVKAFASSRRNVRVILGPHDERFAPNAIDLLQRQDYILTGSADRMGYRLSGMPLECRSQEELISCGVPLGALQVPSDGQPIVLMADHQTTGGYPIIATVIGADIPIVSQSSESDAIQLQVVSIEQAQRSWAEMWDILSSETEAIR